MKWINVLIISMLLFSSFVFAENTQLETKIEQSTMSTGLVGHWKLDNDMLDSTTNANHGTCTGCPTSTTDKDGTVNKAFAFNGTQLIEVADDSALKNFSSLTVSAWINPTANAPTLWGRIAHKSNGATGDDYGLIYQSGNKINFRIGTNTGTTSLSGRVISPNTGWYHVVGTWNGNTIQIYVDGQADTSGSITGTLINSNESFAIGGHADNSQRMFTGHIDDVRVFNRALSTSEVTDLYNSGPTENCNDGIQNQDEICIDVGGVCGLFESGTEISCGDGLDNDCDGQIDGADNDCQTSSFEFLGTHPNASQMPGDSTARELRKIVPFNGKLYFAYGDEDYNNNVGTGPIQVTPYDLGTENFVYEWTAETEAIDNFVEINGNLYLPIVDFHHPTDDFSSTNSYDVLVPGQGWSTGYSTDDFVHAFDIASLNGTDLYLVGGYGSSGISAKVDKSTDGGTTWENVLEEEPQGTYARYYSGGVYQQKLYVQADVWGNLHPNSKVYDGVSWTNGPQLNLVTNFGQHPQEFAGYMVYWGRPGNLMRFDGTNAPISIRDSYKDYTVNDNILYYLESDGEIYSTTDLSNWSFVANAPTGASSIGVLGNYLYIGTTDSKLYRLDLGTGELCGNGIVDAGEQCDDGNSENYDECTNVCLYNVCFETKIKVVPEPKINLKEVIERISWIITLQNNNSIKTEIWKLVNELQEKINKIQATG